MARHLKELDKWVANLLKQQPNSSAANALRGPKKTNKPGATGHVAAEALGAMLHDVFDKDELGAWKQSNRTGGSSSKKKKKAAAPNATAKPTPDTMQMSHVWIKQRLKPLHLGQKITDDILKEIGKQPNYTRHVFLISAIDAYDHVRALVNWMQSKTLNAQDHAKHSITREFTDRDLAVEEKKRGDKRTTGKNK